MITEEEMNELGNKYAETVHWGIPKSDYIAGMMKAIEIYQQGGNTIVSTEQYQRIKFSADKWDAVVAEVIEQQNGEENMYPEDYGYILMNNLGIKDNN